MAACRSSTRTRIPRSTASSRTCSRGPGPPVAWGPWCRGVRPSKRHPLAAAGSQRATEGADATVPRSVAAGRGVGAGDRDARRLRHARRAAAAAAQRGAAGAGRGGFRGRTIGINRFGGAADFMIRYLLRQVAVDPEREAVILQVGAQPERVAALRNGAIQATLVDPPFQALAEREGLRIIADTAELDLAYPLDVLAVNRGWLRA